MTPAKTSRSTPRSGRMRAGRAACLLALLVLAAQSVAAQGARQFSISQHANGFVVQVPSDSTFSQRSGLQLEVDTRWPFNYGYRPVRVRVTAPKSTTAEHRITIRLNVAAWDARHLEVEQSFDLPLGATEAEAILRCPHFQSDHRYWWDVWVDGVRDKELSFDEAASWNLNAAGNANSTSTAVRFLVVGPSAESQRSMGAGSDVFESLTLALAELPTRWIDYSAIDVVALSPSDLDKLARTRPEALTALRRWIRSGGQLWVHPLGEKWERLGEVERQLELTPPPTEHTADSEAALAARGWRPIVFGAGRDQQRVTVQHIPSGRTRIVRDRAAIARLKLDPDYLIMDEPALITDEPVPETTALAAETNATKAADSAKWYIERPAGLGTVRVFRRAWDPVGFSFSWRMLLGSAFGQMPSPAPTTPLTAAIETTRNWQSRHGMAPDLANEDFADLLVPGVGLAPVTEFRVLITVFVLAIGPLNYWLLMRANRLHLMLLTVPLVAFGLTSALFAYALVSDGLSTTVRVRSFTTLDQTTGEAACWARLSYYAGLAPGRGLVLPDDVALYPILPGWNESGDGSSFGVTRKMEWRDGKQLLTAGWLRSRVPTQHLSVRARKSPRCLHVRQAFQPDSQSQSQAGMPDVQVTNDLGTRIVFVAVVDHQGNVFTGEVIADRATTKLNPATHSDALRRLRQLGTENQPTPPPALAGDQGGFLLSQRRGQRRMLQRRFNLDYGVEHLSENLLSGAIAALVEPAAEPVLNVPRSSYVAITETGPEVELGIADAEEQASFHVLVGNWQ